MPENTKQVSLEIWVSREDAEALKSLVETTRQSDGVEEAGVEFLETDEEGVELRLDPFTGSALLLAAVKVTGDLAIGVLGGIIATVVYNKLRAPESSAPPTKREIRFPSGVVFAYDPDDPPTDEELERIIRSEGRVA